MHAQYPLKLLIREWDESMKWYLDYRALIKLTNGDVYLILFVENGQVVNQAMCGTLS